MIKILKKFSSEALDFIMLLIPWWLQKVRRIISAQFLWRRYYHNIEFRWFGEIYFLELHRFTKSHLPPLLSFSNMPFTICYFAFFFVKNERKYSGKLRSRELKSLSRVQMERRRLQLLLNYSSLLLLFSVWRSNQKVVWLCKSKFRYSGLQQLNSKRNCNMFRWF